MILEKSLFDIADFLETYLAAQIAIVNSAVMDSVTIKMPADIKPAAFDIYTDGMRFPRINIIHDPGVTIEELDLGADEFRETIKILIGDKALKTENVSLKCYRLGDAVRAAFINDTTANGAVEFINVTGFKPYLPLNGIGVMEITCSIQRQVAR